MTMVHSGNISESEVHVMWRKTIGVCDEMIEIRQERDVVENVDQY